MTMTQNFIFETVERKVYPRTFLNTVFVVWDYDTANIPDDVVLRIRRFVKDNFNLEIGLTEEEFSHGFSIDNQQAGHSYYFSRGSVGVKCKGENYVSFTETMMPLIYRLSAFVKNVLSSSLIGTIRIRKVNILNARKEDGDHVSEDQLVRDFLSPELTSRTEPVANYLGLDNVKGFYGTTNGDEFRICFGFQKGNTYDGEQFVGLVLDESVSRRSISLNTVDEALLEINSVIFNVFHWSVSPTFIALMNKE